MGKLEGEVRTEGLKGRSEGKVPRRSLKGTVQEKVSREGLGLKKQTNVKALSIAVARKSCRKDFNGICIVEWKGLSCRKGFELDRHENKTT